MGAVDPTYVWPELAIIRVDLDLSETTHSGCAENDLIFKLFADPLL